MWYKINFELRFKRINKKTPILKLKLNVILQNKTKIQLINEIKPVKPSSGFRKL